MYKPKQLTLSIKDNFFALHCVLWLILVPGVQKAESFNSCIRLNWFLIKQDKGSGFVRLTMNAQDKMG